MRTKNTPKKGLDVRMTVRLTTTDMERIERIAKKDHMSVSAVVRRTLSSNI